MKTLSYFLCMLMFIAANNLSYGQKVNIFKKAKEKTEKEINRKVDKKIEDVFNPDKEKKEEPKSTDKPENSENPETENNDPVNEGIPTEKNNPAPETDQPAEPAPVLVEPTPEPAINTVKSDFVAGDKVIFEDHHEFEQMGEFPSKWDLERGSVENGNFDGSNVIIFASSGEIKPLMETERYLPEVFTIEFECYFHRVGNEGYTINFDKISDVRINYNNAQCKGTTSNAKTVGSETGWRKVALSFNQRALKVYLNDERVLNIPNTGDKPTMVYFSALSHSASKGKPAAIKNIRIAEGGVKLYDRLITDGKIVTSDIHFDYNKATLKPESMKEIRTIVDLMKEYPNINLSVEGHTDSDGSESSNLSLSEERAEAVKIAMINLGVSGERLSSKGFGESQPIDSNETHEGKAKNRRVEFILIK